MDQRGPMPPVMRGLVTFIGVALIMTLALTLLQRVHPIAHRAWMVSLYSAAAFAGISAWLVAKKPS